jgi:hypothetical protein
VTGPAVLAEVVDGVGHEADEIATISASIGTPETQQRIAAFLAR